MEIGKVSDVLAAFANALESSGASESGAALKRFASGLSKASSMTTNKLMSWIKRVGLPRTPAGEGPTLNTLESLLDGLAAVLKLAGVKALVTDVELFLDLVRQHGEVSLTQFESLVASASLQQPGATPVDSKQLVDSYLKRLEAALGNDELFRALHRELGADTNRVTKTEMIEIASRFFEPMAPSTSRPKALQKILYRHEKLMESRAASSTIGGKPEYAR
jgi:hypothetical protein